MYAQNFPDKVKAVAPISPVVSGKLSLEAHKKNNPKAFAEWEETGWKTGKSSSIPGLIKKLNWNKFKADVLNYDLIENASKFIMPVLIIVGENDNSTPVEHQQLLFEAIPGDKKELHIIKNAPHTFREPEHLAEIKNIFKNWIKTTN